MGLSGWRFTGWKKGVECFCGKPLPVTTENTYEEINAAHNQHVKEADQ